MSEREGYSDREKSRMMLSQPTLTGIEITGIIIRCMGGANGSKGGGLSPHMLKSRGRVSHHCIVYLAMHSILGPARGGGPVSLQDASTSDRKCVIPLGGAS